MNTDHTTPITSTILINYSDVREVVDAALGDPRGRFVELEIDTDPSHPDADEEG